MAELDTIALTNPTDEDFSVNFNGEGYSVGAGATKPFPEFLAFHIAKHLSDKILGEEVKKLKMKKSENPFRPEIGQLMVYDNPKRRIALYQILGTKELVEECLNAFPHKGFIGEMSEYDAFVEKASKSAKKDEEEVSAK